MILNNDWAKILSDEFTKPYYKKLNDFLDSEYKSNIVYPPREKIFNALSATPFSKVKVVIIGQDPYHGEGQANGLCFSVNKGVKIPPSLRNIFKELTDDLGSFTQKSGDLMKWAKQGVLLLNTVLTVRAGVPNSHKNKGWEHFTDKIISELNKKETPVVFLLWGNHAIKKASVIDNPIHLKLETTHPSPLSAYEGFLGSRHFSKANQFLIEKGIEPIDWNL